MSSVSLGTAPFTVGATDELPGLTIVSFASTYPLVCTVSGNTATLLSTGQCSITASQPGTFGSPAAVPVTQTFNVVNGTAPATCSSPSMIPANPLSIRAEGTDEQINDMTVSCISGNGQPMSITVSLSSTFNAPAVNITSATLGTGGNAVSETLAGMNQSPTTLAAGAVNGVVSGSSVTFTGVPTGVGSFSVSITNIKINASALVPAAASSPVPVAESISVAGNGAVATNFPGQFVAFAYNTLSNVSAIGAATSNAVCKRCYPPHRQTSACSSPGVSGFFRTQGERGSKFDSCLMRLPEQETETGYGVAAGGVRQYGEFGHLASK